MLSDQTVQLLTMLGTWFAGSCTLVAAIIALKLDRRVERVRLDASMDIYEKVYGDDRPLQRYVALRVANLGERPVTLTGVG